MTIDIPVPGPQVLIPGASLCPFIVSPLRTGGQGSLLTYEHRTLRREIKTFFFVSIPVNAATLPFQLCNLASCYLLFYLCFSSFETSILVLL